MEFRMEISRVSALPAFWFLLVSATEQNTLESSVSSKNKFGQGVLNTAGSISLPQPSKSPSSVHEVSSASPQHDKFTRKPPLSRLRSRQSPHRNHKFGRKLKTEEVIDLSGTNITRFKQQRLYSSNNQTERLESRKSVRKSLRPRRGCLIKHIKWYMNTLDIASDKFWVNNEFGYEWTTYKYFHSGIRTTFWPVRYKVHSTPGFQMTPKIHRPEPKRVYIKYPLLYILPVVGTYLIVALGLTYCFGHLYKTENCFHPQMNFLTTFLLMQCFCCCPQRAARLIANKYACRNKCDEECNDEDPCKKCKSCAKKVDCVLFSDESVC